MGCWYYYTRFWWFWWNCLKNWPRGAKIDHCIPREGPKISHDKVKLDSDLPHLQRYAPRCSHSNNFVQLSDRDVFHWLFGFQSEWKFPTRFNRNGFSRVALEREMCIRLMKYWHFCLPRGCSGGLGGTDMQALPVRFVHDVCTFEVDLGAPKRLILVGKCLI